MEERRAAAMAAEQEDKQGQQLPTESSPYTMYEDLEDYKLRGYGTQGHQPPVDQPRGRGGGGTDAPTLSGSGLSQGQAAQAQATDTINRQGVP